VSVHGLDWVGLGWVGLGPKFPDSAGLGWVEIKESRFFLRNTAITYSLVTSCISLGRATELLETPLVRLPCHVRGGTAHPLHLRQLIDMRTRLSFHKLEAVELVRWYEDPVTVMGKATL